MTVHSVSDVTRYIKGLFEGEAVLSDILIRGEVSNFKRYPSGHCYFTLKDAGASMKCVMFNGYARNLRFTPENGMQVIAGGSVSVYERDGVYQLYVNSLTPEGAGALALAFEQLKEKLYAEGLFDEEHKQPLPRFPKRIAAAICPAASVPCTSTGCRISCTFGQRRFATSWMSRRTAPADDVTMPICFGKRGNGCLCASSNSPSAYSFSLSCSKASARAPAPSGVSEFT